MGGDLTSPEGKAAAFLVQALRDPDGANLDRVQIIKGWLDADGKPQERIYDIAVSDGRSIGPDGRCTEPVGNTVDVEQASYSNAIGDAVLGAYWHDPEFDPAQRAFYYVRVLEIPTPRWTNHDAKFLGVKRPTTCRPRFRSGPIRRRCGTRRASEGLPGDGQPSWLSGQVIRVYSFLPSKRECAAQCQASPFPIKGRWSFLPPSAAGWA